MNLDLSFFTVPTIITIAAIGMFVGFAFFTTRLYFRIRKQKQRGAGKGLAQTAMSIARDKRVQTIAVVALVAMMIAAPQTRIAAQSGINIDFSADDLDVFFDYFNMMFNALLGIALLGAGITAGGAFVWVIGQMLTNAFTRMLRGGT